jgi:hypothetical protein
MEDNYSLIELYLLGKLNPTEQKNFEERLQREPELARAFRLQQLEHDALDLMLERDLRHKMTQWETEDAPGTSPQQRPYWPLAAGIALVLLAILGIYWYTRPVTPKPVPTPPEVPQVPPPAPGETPMASTDTATAPLSPTPTRPAAQNDQRLIALAERNYRDDMIRAQLRGNNPGLDSLNEWYNQQQFNKVIAATAIIASTEANYLRQLELRAHAFFHLKKYKDAALLFEQLANSNKEPFAERSDWFYLLALAAQGDAAKTKLMVQNKKILAAPDHTFYEEVVRLNLK